MDSMKQLIAGYSRYQSNYRDTTSTPKIKEEETSGLLTRRSVSSNMENKTKDPSDIGAELFNVIANKRKDFNNATDYS